MAVRQATWYVCGYFNKVSTFSALISSFQYSTATTILQLIAVDNLN